MSVLVFVENWDGRFKKLSFELVSYAAKVAEMLGSGAIAVSIGNVGDAELSKLAAYGASKIISVEGDQFNILDNQNYTLAVAEVAGKNGANVVILSNNNLGKAIAPRVAVRLKAGLGAGVSRLPVSTDPFVVYKKSLLWKRFCKSGNQIGY